jgi:CRISPR-associated protein Csy2
MGMSQYIVVNRIKVQNANAIAGFTWGFPAITNFLGFVQNLSRKLAGMKIKRILLVDMSAGLSRVAIRHI